MYVHVRGIAFSASAWHRKVMGLILRLGLDGSMLDPNRVIAKDVKVVPTAAMSDAVRVGKCLGPKQTQLITMHS